LISRNFIKSSLIYTLAGALPMASAVILLPFYIAYLPTEAYGALSVCLAFSYLVQVIVAFSFDSSLYVHYHELKVVPDQLSKFISSSFIFMLGWALIVGIILSVSGQLIFTLTIPNSKVSFYPYGIIAAGVGVCQAIFKVHGNLLQIREKPEPFLWSNVGNFAVIAISTIIGLKLFPNTLVGPLGGRLLAGFLSCSWVLIRIFREFGFHAQSPWQQTSFSFNVFTFIYQLLQWTVNYFDRFLILLFMPLSAVGIYDFATKCLVPIELLLNGLNAAINPKVVKIISQQKEKRATPDINRYFYGLVSVIMLAICLAIIVVPGAIDLFISKSGYAESLRYIPYLGAIYILKALRIYFVVPYTVLKKMQKLTALNIFTSALKIGLMIWLISQWQLYGVILSSLLVHIVEMCLLWYFLKQDYPMRFNFVKLLGVPLFVFLIILVVELQFGTTYSFLSHALVGLLCVTLLGFAYRNEMKLIDPVKMFK
jgi:O-antigen/teichoic acid export membrane protein